MFKHEFKYYKSRKPPPDLTKVLDFNNYASLQNKVSRIVLDESQGETLPGLKPVEQWEVYELIDNPGLIFIRNPFTSLGQRYWILRCLRDYTKKPNKSNLDIHGIIPEEQDWWEMCLNSEDKITMEKLRWVTLGYHHNWNTKVYSEESRNEFPPDLALLGKYIADTLNYKDFSAQAAIVNYYHMDSTLSGHTDHSEQFLEAPLFSISFGQSAIFLLGGPILDVKPSAMFLHSGDVIIMSKESRLCYHGVPKILGAPETPWCTNSGGDKNLGCGELDNRTLVKCTDDTFWKPFSEYLKYSRININIRQVLKAGQKCLDS